MPSTKRRLVVIASTTLTLVACAASPKLLGAPVQKPIALTFNATPEVAGHLDPAALAITIEHLKEGLKERGIASYTPKIGEPAPAPRIDLSVRHWQGKVDIGREMSPGSYWAGLIGPPGVTQAIHAHDVEIECIVLREGDRKPTFRHTFAGYSGKDVVDDMLSRIFTDKAGDDGVGPPPGVDLHRHY